MCVKTMSIFGCSLSIIINIMHIISYHAANHCTITSANVFVFLIELLAAVLLSLLLTFHKSNSLAISSRLKIFGVL